MQRKNKLLFVYQCTLLLLSKTTVVATILKQDKKEK